MESIIEDVAEQTRYAPLRCFTQNKCASCSPVAKVN